VIFKIDFDAPDNPELVIMDFDNTAITMTLEDFDDFAEKFSNFLAS
jgi:hypothetical protein